MAKKLSHINPDFKRKSSVVYSWEECLDGVKAGSANILAYLISKGESQLDEDQRFIRDFIAEVPISKYPRKLAISGAPGVGKSCLIDSFGQYLIEQGNRLAILPVDPSSYLSKGSILGDKTRMELLSLSENSFIKPMPSSLSLGGLAPATAIASMICERSNFDYIILETVGVGQSEVEARDLVDMFILLLQAGGGDDLQGIKRGIMELADLFIVTKADGSLLKSAENTMLEIKQANQLLLANSFNWHAEVISHSSNLNQGNDILAKAIEEYYSFMESTGDIDKLRHMQECSLFEKQSKEMIIAHMLIKPGVSAILNDLKSDIDSGSIMAIAALQKLEEKLNENS